MDESQQTSADSARPEEKRGKKDYKVSAAVFVRTWQLASSGQEVADLLNMPRPVVYARACFYRRMGVGLKKMSRGKTEALDVAALNQLLDHIQSEQAAPKE